MKKLMIGIGAAALVALGAGCGSGSSSPQNCMILAEGGNRVCGEDAKTWCDTTDAIRTQGIKAASDVDYGDPSTAAMLRSAQADCDTIRGR